MKSFALIGAAGYVAPRHMRAISEVGGNLAVALDPHDSIGIIDSYFPKAAFFTEFERFDRHVELLKREVPENRIQYVSICSPNYLHDSHVRFSLRSGAHAICEKPLVLNPWNVEALQRAEKEYGSKVYTILQLRYHPSIVNLKNTLGKTDKVHDIDLTYITSRGNWYYYSWKGQDEKSGGVITNIGIHFFDMLGWIFGELKSYECHYRDESKASGYLEFSHAKVRWFLSINEEDLPGQAKSEGKRTYRSLSCDGEEVEFSHGFEDLHTYSYRKILSEEGFGLEDARPSIEIVHDLRKTPCQRVTDHIHPFLKK